MVNTTFRTYVTNHSIAQNNLSNSIYNRVGIWSLFPYQNGYLTKVNCYSGDYNTCGNSVSYVRSDMKALALAAAEAISDVVGIAIKIQETIIVLSVRWRIQIRYSVMYWVR
jgi:hypothetical protein